jgi:hypothetical protein
LKKKEEKSQRTTTKPVLESSNPFFIAVCAPETYKSSAATAAASAAAATATSTPVVYHNDPLHRVKPNVFLRSRPRTNLAPNNLAANNLAYPNRFIHHPTLQHERQRETTAGTTTTTTEAGAEAGAGGWAGMGTSASTSTRRGILTSDIEHFPSLKSSSVPQTTVASSTSVPKLNFKDMVLKNTASTTAATATEAGNGSGIVVYSAPSFKSSIIPQKSLSSSNIFSAAFHAPDDDNHDCNADDNYVESTFTNNGRGGGGGGGSVIASSILIDSCDKKYDRMYQ